MPAAVLVYYVQTVPLLFIGLLPPTHFMHSYFRLDPFNLETWYAGSSVHL